MKTRSLSSFTAKSVMPTVAMPFSTAAHSWVLAYFNCERSMRPCSYQVTLGMIVHDNGVFREFNGAEREMAGVKVARADTGTTSSRKCRHKDIHPRAGSHRPGEWSQLAPAESSDPARARSTSP